jgi:hypothetical protein
MSSTAVGSAPKASVRVMKPRSLAATGTGLASRVIGTRTLGFAIGRGAVPPVSATTSSAVAVGTPDDAAVASLDGANDRPDPTDDLSANRAVSSNEASKFCGDADM